MRPNQERLLWAALFVASGFITMRATTKCFMGETAVLQTSQDNKEARLPTKPPKPFNATSEKRLNQTIANANITSARGKYYYDTDLTSFPSVTVKAWEHWQADFPCFENDGATPESLIAEHPPLEEGFFFNKPVKTASSTAASIQFRITRNQAKKQRLKSQFCKMEWWHFFGHKAFPRRNRTKSFLWSIVRDPTSRIISLFFFLNVSRYKQEPLDKTFIARLRAYDESNEWQDHYLHRLSKTKYLDMDPIQTINAIMQEYDFIAVTERLDESVVAMAMLLNLPLSDMLYLSAKRKGGFDDGAWAKCIYIVPSFVSPGMKAFFQTREFQDLVRWDYIFHQAANKSLDLTIEKLGRTRFQEQLTKYKEAQKAVQEHCFSRIRLPCSADGGETKNEEHCVIGDMGCGLECLDEVADQLNLWEPIK